MHGRVEGANLQQHTGIVQSRIQPSIRHLRSFSSDLRGQHADIHNITKLLKTLLAESLGSIQIRAGNGCSDFLLRETKGLPELSLFSRLCQGRTKLLRLAVWLSFQEPYRLVIAALID